MPLVKVGDKRISFPDDMNGEEISKAIVRHAALGKGEANLLNFHNESLKDPLVNEDGSKTTVYITGVPIGDQIYSVPAFDQQTKTILSPQQIVERWQSVIESDPDYFPHHPAEFDGPIEQHPANVWAKEFHKKLE